MKKPVLIVWFIAWCLVPAFAQTLKLEKKKAAVDSISKINTGKLQRKIDSLQNIGHSNLSYKDSIMLTKKTDSLKSRWGSGISTVQHKWQNGIDSLKGLGNFEKMKDSLKVLTWGDSLRKKVKTAFGKTEQSLKGKLDSLTKLNLPTDKIAQKTDSLKKKQQLLLGEISSKQNALQQKINGRYKKWGSKLDSLGLRTPTFATTSVKTTTVEKASVDAPNLPNVNANIPGMDKAGNQLNSLNTKLPSTSNIKLPNAYLPNSGIPTTSLPNVSLPNTSVPNTSIPNPTIPNTSLPNASLPSLNTSDFANLNLSKDLSDVGGKLSVPGTDQMKQWNDQLKNVASPLKEATGKLNGAKGALKDPGKAAEEAAKQLKDVNTISKEMGNADKLMKDNEALKTAEAMKDPQKLKEEAAKIAINHFAGKEEILKQAMDQMAEIKKKVPSLESLDKLPKHLWIPRNGLKGKPFRERIRYGLNIGVQGRKDSVVMDLYPNASYYLTDRIELGGGMIYRLRESTRTWQFDQANPVWGFNMFGTFKAFKAVRFRLEADAASYPKYGGLDELIHRRWRWTVLMGIQTEFKISEHFTGNVQLLHNFDKSLTAGFPEQLVLRFGLQYRLKSKAKE